MMPEFDASTHVAKALERDGYAVLENFAGADLVAALAQECRDLQLQARLQPAAIGRAGARRVDQGIRGDSTYWFDASMPTVAQSRYFAHMHTLRHALNRRLLLGLDELEAHYASYSNGTGYARHRDRFRDDDTRVVSSVLYLNPEWRDSDGGALRLHLPMNPTAPFEDIYPLAGTLALFLSADVEHEVLPAARERLSVAGWFRRRALR